MVVVLYFYERGMSGVEHVLKRNHATLTVYDIQSVCFSVYYLLILTTIVKHTGIDGKCTLLLSWLDLNYIFIYVNKIGHANWLNLFLNRAGMPILTFHRWCMNHQPLRFAVC